MLRDEGAGQARVSHATSPFRSGTGWRGGWALWIRATTRRTLQAYLGHRNIQHTVRHTELSLYSMLVGW